MTKVVVHQGDDSGRVVAEAIEQLGLDFVDLVKGATSICIVGTGSFKAVQAIVDVIAFHSRVPVHVLCEGDERDAIETTIPRGDGVRMPVRRPRCVMEADVVIAFAGMTSDRAQRTHLALEQYVFATWYVPERQTSRGIVRTHEPWLEGDLRNDVLAELYAQKPVALAILDGTQTAGVVLAGFDCLAVDAVGMHMLGVNEEELGYAQRLAQNGHGVCTLSKIDVPLGVISR